jgi:hypothetical protein
MLSGHSDFKSLTLRYKWALCHGRALSDRYPRERFVREVGEGRRTVNPRVTHLHARVML